MQLRDQFTREALPIPGIEKKRSRFSANEAFWYGGKAIAHFHHERVLGLRLTRKTIRAMQAAIEEDDRYFWRSRSSDWLEFEMRQPEDVQQALSPLQQAIATVVPR